MEAPEISVVIRTFNEEKYLPALLEGINSQTPKNFETIIVDSGSFDGTLDIANGNCDKLLSINSEDFTFGYSLNVGINAASGLYIAIVSAHTKPVDADWLRNLTSPLLNSRTAMSYGRQLGWETSNYSETQDLARTYGPRRKVLVPPGFFANNANSAIRKDLWCQHGFDEILPGLEDIEWAKYWMNRGYQVVYEPSAALYHIHEETPRQIRNRYYRESLAATTIGVTTRSQLPLELAREGKRFVLDIYKAARENNVRGRFWEIVSFRFNKCVGTARGLWEGPLFTNDMQTNDLFFDKSRK